MIAASSRDYARSSFILSAAISAEYAFRFVQKMILARLLFPEAFGLMGAVMAAISAMEAMADLGLRQLVIQHKRGSDERFLATVWCCSALRGLVLFVVAFAIAPWCAAYFQSPGADNLFRAGFTGMLISSLISPRIFLLEKQFKFGAWALVMQLAAFTGSLATIAIAFVTRDASALVAGYIIEIAMRVTLSYILCPFVPRLGFSPDVMPEIFRFMRGMFGLSALTMICLQIDLIFLGRMASLPVLGCYVMAKTLSEVLSFLSLKVINPVFLPGLSRLKDQPAEVADVLYQATGATALFVLPVMTWMIACAHPLLTMAYGEPYQIAATAFRVLCFNTFIFGCSSLMMILFIAMGEPGHQRTAALIRVLMMLAGMAPFIQAWELTGAAAAMCLSGLAMLVTQLILAQKIVPIRMQTFAMSLWPGIKLAALFVGLPWVAMRVIIPDDAVLSMMLAGVGGMMALITAARTMWRRHDLPGLFSLLSLKTA